jgi:protocatechuate 3,4-dioxygenase beta subunit
MPGRIHRRIHRRTLIAGASAIAAGLAAPAAARQLMHTPRQTEGPFYPDRMPPDIDADLLRVPGRKPYTKGQVAHVRGRVLGPAGQPLTGIKVEIWQCDAGGRYHHTGDGGRADRDFQGYGHVITGRDGVYAFRTLRPVEYPGRTPHIHFKLSRARRDLLTTQMYVAGDPGNLGDSLFQSLGAAGQRALSVTFKPADQIEKGSLLGTFDIVLRPV